MGERLAGEILRELLEQGQELLQGASPGRVDRDVRQDEVDRLADGLDVLGLVLSDADAVGVLELDDQLDEVERVGFEVFLEPAVLLDDSSVDTELIGKVGPDQLQHLSPVRRRRAHGTALKLSAGADARRTPASASAPARRPATSCSTPRSAKAMALAIARLLEAPWDTTTRPRSPSR